MSWRLFLHAFCALRTNIKNHFSQKGFFKWVVDQLKLYCPMVWRSKNVVYEQDKKNVSSFLELQIAWETVIFNVRVFFCFYIFPSHHRTHWYINYPSTCANDKWRLSRWKQEIFYKSKVYLSNKNVENISVIHWIHLNSIFNCLKTFYLKVASTKICITKLHPYSFIICVVNNFLLCSYLCFSLLWFFLWK